MRSSNLTRTLFFLCSALSLILIAGWLTYAAETVPTDIEQPGTQPGEFGTFNTNCDSCHARTDAPELEPSFGWHGSMMSHAMRDPLFWATVAVAEQDFLPNADPALRGGAGDLCLRCHGPSAWLGGRSTPTNGGALAGDDERGVECESCHLMLDPDLPLNIPGTTEVQNSPYLAYDATNGEGYHGSAQYVMNGEGTRVGPYDDAVANHAFLKSNFVRDGDFCGTCHDVSNAAVGDLAHNNGAQVPLLAGSFSGVPGSPVAGKAAFNNPPFAYGVVERTYSEWKASALDDYPVRDFASLPAELQVVGGAPEVAYSRAMAPTNNANRPDYVDGDVRTYTCQTCHMAAAEGKGCNKPQSPVRYDLPRHDLTGGATWIPEVILYQQDQGTLLFGSVDGDQELAMVAAMDRAENHLKSAARLEAWPSGGELRVRVTNLTGHKLISGYPEGRRMWLHVEFLDGASQVVGVSGGYGPIGRSIADQNEVSHQVQSLLDPDNTVIYDVAPGLDQQWAAQLLALGYDSGLPLAYDRDDDSVVHTLGELAAEQAGSAYKSFRFVLNNVVVRDSRIPPWRFDYDEALARSTLPVPASRYGDPGPGGEYDHWDEVGFAIPVGAVTAEVHLMYQPTSWEYIQFLWLANDRQDAFLGSEGDNLLDAWLNTGMAPPEEMAETTVALPSTGSPGETLQLIANWNAAAGMVDATFAPSCDADEHVVYYGDLATVASPVYGGATCALGTSGTASFDPGAGDVFFILVGQNLSAEGSYGTDSDGLERLEATGLPECDLPRDLGGVVCE